VVVLSLAISMVGAQIARVGFDLLQPVSVLQEEIRKDPTSPIAMAATIREKNRETGVPLPVRLAMPILAAAVMAALDARRRPVAACLAYGIAIFALYGWSTSRSPAFPLPTTGETAVALVLAVLAALAGAALSRRLADALEPGAAPAPSARLATSPGR
jgi:hypothetical protein